MANFKPVIGFDDNLSNHLQNYAPTAYAVSKMRAGRTPRDVKGDVIKDANALFRPGLYYLDTGSLHITNEDTESVYPVYLYTLVQDPDESLKGGHALADDTINWHKNVPMHFRQIIYACSANINNVTTRTGERDAAIASLLDGSYKIISTVQQIEPVLKSLAPIATAYAYVCDIAMWIRYTITNSVITGTKVTWVPAITWTAWRSITGDNPVTLIEQSMTLTPDTHYVSFGQYNLELPNANKCSLGAKIIVDQWINDSFVRTYSEDGSTLISEMQITPCVANPGVSNMALIGDDAVAPDKAVFTKNVDFSWGYTNATTSKAYTVEKIQLSANVGETEGRERWAITFVSDNVKYIERVTPDDSTYPFNGSAVYVLTEDTVAVTGTQYYEKIIVSGVETYARVTIAAGTLITGNLYECSSSIRWYDVTDRTVNPPVYKKPTDISAAEITDYTKKSTAFSVTAVEDNVVGAGQYTFEVTYDKTTTSNKVWALERCSDFEALMNQVTQTIGTEVKATTKKTDVNTDSIQTTQDLLMQYRNQYYQHDYAVRITVEGIIYGDNAKSKSASESLIIFNKSEFLETRGGEDLTAGSMIIDYFRARLDPTYIVAKGINHTFYLPTKVVPVGTDESGNVTYGCTLVGKRIRFLIEPGATIIVCDDNSSSSETVTTYTFTGYQESTSTVDPHPKMTEVVFEMVAYKSQSGDDAYAWIYTQRVTNASTYITAEDIANAIAIHDRSESCHSGTFAKRTAFENHVSDTTSHITAAERNRWDTIAGSGTTSAVARDIANQVVIEHNASSGAHPDKITSTTLMTSLALYATRSELTTSYVNIETLKDYPTSATTKTLVSDILVSNYLTSSATRALVSDILVSHGLISATTGV